MRKTTPGEAGRLKPEIRKAQPDLEDRHDEQDHAHHALDRIHPGTAPAEIEAEHADDEERCADPQRVQEEQERPERDRLVGRDVGQDAQQDRPRAGRGDEPRHQPHAEGAREPGPTHLVQPQRQPRRERDLEGPEHRQGQGDEKESQHQRNDRAREGLAKGLAREPGCDAQGHEGRGHPQDIAAGERRRPAAPARRATASLRGPPRPLKIATVMGSGERRMA